MNIYVLNVLHDATVFFPQFNPLIYVVAEKVDWYVVLVGILFILLHRHGARLNRPVLFSRIAITEGLYTISGVMIAWLISHLMKISFMVARPFIQFSEIIPLFSYGGYESFPSGHATLFAALGTAIYLHHRDVGALFIFAAFTISIARVVAGVHFPIDILVGWIIGASISYLTYRYMQKRHAALVRESCDIRES